MAILSLNGNDTQTKQQAYFAYLNANSSNSAAVRRYPDLGADDHLALVDLVKETVMILTGFVELRRNYYVNQRVKVGGDINGPATTLKFDFIDIRNFRVADASKLHAALTIAFPSNSINVSVTDRKPVCIVHVGL